MDEFVASYHAKNGLLRKFSDGELSFGSMQTAKISHDGSLCAVLCETDLVTFLTFNQETIKVVVSEDVFGFCWSRHTKDAYDDLSMPSKKQYLVVIDGGLKINLFAVFKEKEKKGDTSCKVELTSCIGKEALFDGVSETENNRGSLETLEVLEATYYDCNHFHEVLLLVDNEEIVRIRIKGNKEPTINLRIPLNSSPGPLQRTQIICSKVKDSILLLVSEEADIYIISLFRKALLQRFNLLSGVVNLRHDENEGYFTQDHGGYSIVKMCDISNDLGYALVYRQDEVLHLIKINISEIEAFDEASIENDLNQSISGKRISRLLESRSLQYGLEVQNKVWKNELNGFHQELIDAENSISDQGFSLDQMDPLNVYRERHNADVFLAENVILHLPEWSKGYRLHGIFMSGNTVLLKMTLETEYFSSSETEMESVNIILVKYDIHSEVFSAQSLPENSVIATSSNNFIPNCFLTHEAMYVPTFDATQEELTSSIIQFTGIAEAEVICRSNEWSQFSIPLHSLEIGLQYRQVDTISFFLRTRNKAFSRYWRSASQASMAHGASDSSDIRASSDYVGSPSSASVKSVLIKSSLESTSVDCSELHKAVDMLIKAIHQNSKDKNKRNFFETLLRLTLDFLSSLIMDGTEVWETVVQPMSLSMNDANKNDGNFIFLANIPQSLKYLAESMVDIRQFVGDVPEFFTLQEESRDLDTEDGHQSDQNLTLKEFIEAKISTGRISYLQKYLVEQSQKAKGSIGCTFGSITDYGLKFALRKLMERNIEDAVNILKNLGTDHKAILRQLFDVTLDRGLRNFLLEHFRNEPYHQMLSEDDWKDVIYLNEVEKFYPCNSYSKSNETDTWKTLMMSFHDIDDIEVTVQEFDRLKSLAIRDDRDSIQEGLYSELTFDWVKGWDEKSRKMVLIEASFQNKEPEKLKDLTDAECLWEYLINHNDQDRILEWIREFAKNDDAIDMKYPPFETNFIEKCENATEQLQKTIYREFLRQGIYTEYMQQNFNKTVKLISEDCTLLINSDDHHKLPTTFSNQFIVYCVKNNLRELLYIFLDHHELYPSEKNMQKLDLDIDKYQWFKMMMAFRNYTKDQNCIYDMNLSTAENILNISGDDLKRQLCVSKPLTVLAALLSSSLELNKVFGTVGRNVYGFDVSLLQESLMQYPTLYAALFKDANLHEGSEVTTVQLLQDNTDLDAKKFFEWRLQENCIEGDSSTNVPNFSSKTLVEKYGMLVEMSYLYYLKQRRPVHAYVIFMRDVPDNPVEKEHRLSEAYKNAYEIATTNFDKIPITTACIFFINLLGLDDLPLKVDIETANFLLEKWAKRDENQFDTVEKLQKFIAKSLGSHGNERLQLLQMLEECVEAGFVKENIEWSSFAAILSYRIAVQFAQISNLPPSTRIIEETIKDDCWFHSIVYMQIYQLKPSEVIPALEKSMTNTVLLDHMCAIVKNAKEMTKTFEDGIDVDRKPKKSELRKHVVKSAALERNFRAQFYFNLKKGAESRPLEPAELVSPAKSSSSASSLTEEKMRVYQPLNKHSSGSSESIDEKPSERLQIRLDAIQPLDDILDIILECEESGYPSQMLLKYAVTYSQPFLTVLAACYKDSIPINCLSMWIVSNVKKERRNEIFKNVPADFEQLDWTPQAMFDLLSDLILKEEKAVTIISQGFKIFMKGNLLYPFFMFCESFAAKDNDEDCIKHLKAFTRRLSDSSEDDDPYAQQFFSHQIAIKILISFKSKHYKRKLLQHYIDAGLDDSSKPEFTTFTRLSVICDITKDTDIEPEYLELALDPNNTNCEENRIYEFLIEQKYLEKAENLAKALHLPSWKTSFSQVKTELSKMTDTVLWQSFGARFEFWIECNARLQKCRCDSSVAGRFFETQGLTSQELLYEERALLLAIAYHWFRSGGESDAGSQKTVDLNDKLNDLEKRVWVFKMNAEMLKSGQVREEEDAANFRVINSCNLKISEFLSGRVNKGSVASLQNDRGRNLLVEGDDFNFQNRDSQTQLTEQEREAFEIIIGQLLENCEIEQAKRASILFREKTRDLDYVLSAISLAKGTKHLENLDESIKSLLAKTPKRSFSLSSGYEPSLSLNRTVSVTDSTASPGITMADWVVVEEVQNAIENLLSKCRRGRKCCERVLICFKISKILSMNYQEIVTLEPFRVLRMLVYCDMDQQRHLCRQFIKAFVLKDEEVAAFIAKIVVRVIQSKANLELNSMTMQEFTDTTKLNSNEIPQLMQLVQQPSSLGAFLIDEAKLMEANTQSDCDVNVLEARVELLIRAHDCFTLSCNMEGISEVLHAARLCTMQLVKNKAYSSMVRILTGIGRFKEMSYIFQALAEEHHFELLFRKDIEKEAQLKKALLDYIKLHHPNDTEKMDLLSMRFGMHREVGEQLEETGEKQIQAFSSNFPGSVKDLEQELKSIVKTFSYAAVNFQKVDSLRKFARCKKVARLAELQIRLLPTGKKIIGLEKNVLTKFLSSHQDFYEALIVADGYNFASASTWVEPLFERVVVKGDMNYLKQYLSVYHLTTSVVTEIVSRYRSERSTSNMSENLRNILMHLRDIKSRYKLARDLGFNNTANDMLEAPSGAFLKDSLFAF